MIVTIFVIPDDGFRQNTSLMLYVFMPLLEFDVIFSVLVSFHQEAWILLPQRG